MEQYITELIALIKAELSEVGDRIQPGAIDPEMKPPYLAFTQPTTTPIRTIHGVAGYNTTIDFAVVSTTFVEVQDLSTKLTLLLDSVILDNRKLLFVSSKDKFFNDEKLRNLHGKILTFKIK